MPFSDNSSLPAGVKGLPEGQQSKWRKVFNAAYEGTCKDKSGDERDKCASRIAWSQIDDKYKGKSTALASFTMTIKSATHDRQKDTLRWKAIASDTDEDYFHDNMSLELFNDFTSRIEIKELVPEEFRSTFWQGGMPYLSISHYPDLEGKASPGIAEEVYVDGNRLNANGEFFKTPLGLTCYHKLCSELRPEAQTENPIRISIAFLDWGHVHKSNGYEFVRKDMSDFCRECMREELEHLIEGTELSGKIFKKGQLVHLALTRVPANERTSMEVEKSMTTRKEDAESIIGEELAKEIDEKAKLVGKSTALVIKTDADDAEAEPETVEEVVEPVTEPELVEEAKSSDKKKDDMEEDGEDCAEDKKKMHKKSAVDDRLDRIEKMIVELSKPAEPKPEPVVEHELDTVFSTFKAQFDAIKVAPEVLNDKLRMLQEPFNQMANVVRNLVEASVEPVEETPQQAVPQADMVKALSTALVEAMRPVSDKLDLILTQNKDMVKSVAETPAQPVRRSLPPTLSMQNDIRKVTQVPQRSPSPTPKLDAIINKSVGLP